MTAISAGPESSFMWHQQLSTEQGAEFPVDTDNTSLQFVPDFRVKAAVTWRF